MVAPSGKVSGKWISEGLAWTLAADWLDGYDPETGAFRATLAAKSGRLVEPLALEVGADGVASTEGRVAR